MKKGIEVWTDYDARGRWRLNIKKKRGKLSINEIKVAAREWEYDYYLLVLDCFHEENDIQFYFDKTDSDGDFVQLYRTDLLYADDEH